MAVTYDDPTVTYDDPLVTYDDLVVAVSISVLTGRQPAAVVVAGIAPPPVSLTGRQPADVQLPSMRAG